MEAVARERPFSWTSVLPGLKQRAEFAEKRASIEMHHSVQTSFIGLQERSSTSDPSTLQEKQERPQPRKDETHALRCGTERRSRVSISMDGKGAWRDNVFVERLWRSVKHEEVYLNG